MEDSVDLKDIKAIIDLMKKNSITEFELERGQEFKIKLKRGHNGTGNMDDGIISAYPQVVVPASPTGMPVVAAATQATAAGNEQEIKSPMIGTFYRAPSPESGPYVDIGTEVNPDTVVCIIEAMKVMNEIKAEVRGVVTSVQVDNAKPVEFGQPLFKVRPL